MRGTVAYDRSSSQGDGTLLLAGQGFLLTLTAQLCQICYGEVSSLIRRMASTPG